MGKAELEKLLGVRSENACPRKQEQEHKSRIIVFRKRLKTGEYEFSCRGYKKVSNDKNFPYNAGDFLQARDFAFAFRIVDVE